MIEMISDPGAYETSGPSDHPDPGNPKKTPQSGAKVGQKSKKIILKKYLKKS
jgi:hypothetical protein